MSDKQEPVALNDCPPGLFWFNGTLGFKSEYVTTLENPRRYQVDAYVVSSGEYFHGGARDSAERGRLLVEPIDADGITRADHPADDGLVAAVRSTTDRHRRAERDDLPSTVVNTKFLGIILTALRAQSDAEVEREAILVTDEMVEAAVDAADEVLDPTSFMPWRVGMRAAIEAALGEHRKDGV